MLIYFYSISKPKNINVMFQLASPELVMTAFNFFSDFFLLFLNVTVIVPVTHFLY